jgi:hypothetical protein
MTDGNIDASRGDGFAELGESHDLLRRELVAGELAHREMAPEPFELDAGELRDAFDEGDSLLEWRALTVHAGVDAGMDGDRPAGERRSFAQRLRDRERRHACRQLLRHDLLRRIRRRLDQQDDRSIDAGLPQADTFLDERDTEPRRAGVQGRPRDLDVTVAVGVGLHHRECLYFGRGVRSERADVVTYRAEVYLRIRGAPAAHRAITVRIAPEACRARATVRSAEASASAMSPAAIDRWP